MKYIRAEVNVLHKVTSLALISMISKCLTNRILYIGILG